MGPSDNMVDRPLKLIRILSSAERYSYDLPFWTFFRNPRPVLFHQDRFTYPKKPDHGRGNSSFVQIGKGMAKVAPKPEMIDRLDDVVAELRSKCWNAIRKPQNNGLSRGRIFTIRKKFFHIPSAYFLKKMLTDEFVPFGRKGLTGGLSGK